MYVRSKPRNRHSRSNRLVVGCNEIEAVYKKRHFATKRASDSCAYGNLVRVRELSHKPGD